MGYVIGIDFDNTIVNYDNLVWKVAWERGITFSLEKDKNMLRDHIRQLPNGETEWQRVQAIVYGLRISEANLIDGVAFFFQLCRRNEAKTYIISHKTEFAAQDETRTNLRLAALNWMRANNFFNNEGLGLSPEAVYFGLTRHEKIELIRNLGCTHFIDDLEETFLEENFPINVQGILYSPRPRRSLLANFKVMGNWQEISHYLFGTRE